MLGAVQVAILLALSVGSFALEVFALVDALRRRPDAFVAAGKRTKTFWAAVLGLATAFGVLGLPPLNLGLLSPLSILAIVSVVAAAVYLTDVRPAVRQIRGGGGRSGPYGPW